MLLQERKLKAIKAKFKHIHWKQRIPKKEWIHLSQVAKIDELQIW